ncbi:MAG: hypothetical protein K2N56_08520, partial [Oscillospiraceae bacterium]|nr:hypothetical protein [Oscillospiraceae bacterium]
LVLILHVNLLFPWQQESRKNKQAILEYVNENYPGAKIVSQSYDYGFKLRPRKNDVIDFKWDDIEFHVSADDGKIVRDSYPEARATAQFDKIIKDGFLRPRQITSAVSSYTFYDDYIEPYTGEVTIELDIVGEGVIPQKIEWLYDFYKYWKKEGAFLREYQVYLVIYETNSKEDSYIIIKKDSEFADENEFYSAFKKYW